MSMEGMLTNRLSSPTSKAMIQKKNIIITINIYIYIYKAKNIPNLIPLSLCRSHLRHNDELPNSDNFRHRLPSKYSNHI